MLLIVIDTAMGCQLQYATRLLFLIAVRTEDFIMKKTFTSNILYGLLTALFLLAIVFPVYFASALPFGASATNEDHKVTICHVPPGNPENVHAIEIDKNAWESGHNPHNAHDMDYLADSNGSCAKQSVQTPDVPDIGNCPSPLTSGDWSHQIGGTHHIPGQEAPIAGQDEVYRRLGGNFLQCLCPSNTNEMGYQTQWWRIAGLNLSSEQIDKLLLDGWSKQDGQAWNLISGAYLAKNSRFSCVTSTPIPTPSPTVTPTPTSTPAPTDSSRGGIPQCVALTATVKSGTAPLSVMFTAEANDPNGKIEEYEFNFNDISGGQGQYAKQTGRDVTHTFYNSGSFDVTAKARDNDGNWEGGDDCKVSISVNGAPNVLGSSNVTQLPKTGFFAPAVLASLPFIWVGVKVYRRFKLV